MGEKNYSMKLLKVHKKKKQKKKILPLLWQLTVWQSDSSCVQLIRPIFLDSFLQLIVNFYNQLNTVDEHVPK